MLSELAEAMKTPQFNTMLSGGTNSQDKDIRLSLLTHS